MKINLITVDSVRIFRILTIIALFLIVVDIAGQLTRFLTGHGRVFGLIKLFNLNTERNIPTAFSCLLLFFAAFLIGVIAFLEKKRNSSVLHWAILSAGFIFAGFDEVWCFHESWNVPMQKALGGQDLGFFYWAWVIPGIGIALVVGLFYFKFLLRLPSKTRFAFLLAATIFLGGALGVEMIGGRYAELYGIQNLTYSMLTIVEESFEMIGLIIFLWSLMDYISFEFKEFRLIFNGCEV